MTRALWRRALATACLLLSTSAHAGRSCEVQRPDAVSVRQAMSLAQHVAQRLDTSGSQVVMLARAGQDLRRYGLGYSHFALAYRDDTPGRDGAWRVVHKLNQCGTAQGALYRQGLGEFFLDDLFDYQAGIVLLAPEVQARLLPVVRDNQRLAQLNTSAYNMVAYPWSQTYQQSNQWALETFAMAQDPAATTRERAQAWLRLHDYQPTSLHINALTRLGARISAANIAFDDHPNAKRFSDRIETVTVDSVFAWLQRSGYATQVLVVR